MDLLKNLDDMITVEEFYEENTSGFLDENECKQLMIEFAKLHVTEALKQASENVEYSCYIKYNDPYDFSAGIDCLVDELNKNSILNAYPLDNIK